MESTQISKRTLERNMKYLNKLNLVTKRKAERRNGEKYEFYINPYSSATSGFIRLNASLVELLFLKKLNDAELTLYVYLKYMVGNSEKVCWASQNYLAEQLGKESHSTITKLTDELHRKKMIKKVTEKIGRVNHSTYSLLK
jgi:hypothetical protein